MFVDVVGGLCVALLFVDVALCVCFLLRCECVLRWRFDVCGVVFVVWMLSVVVDGLCVYDVCCFVVRLMVLVLWLRLPFNCCAMFV